MPAGEDPTLTDREQAVVRALHRAAATERAPARLRERLEDQRAERKRARTRSGWAGLPALGTRTMSAVGVAALAVVVAAVLLIPGGAGTPSVAAAAALGSKGSTLQAPEADPTATYLLTARVENLRFPNWEEQEQGWVATGARTDQLGNRDVTTVFYQRDDQTIAYSIVSSPVLPGTSRRSFTHGGRTVFIWRERGHTCLLSGKGVTGAELQQLVRQSESRHPA